METPALSTSGDGGADHFFSLLSCAARIAANYKLMNEFTTRAVSREIIERAGRATAASQTSVHAISPEMSKPVERWLLFKYVHGELTLLSKPFKTKEHAEKARLKYPERERKTIGVGVIRLSKEVRRGNRKSEKESRDSGTD